MVHISRLIICLALASLTACKASAPETAAPDYPAPDYAAAPMDRSTPQGTAYAMMMAMYRGDAESIDKIFAKGGRLSRIRADGSLEPDGLTGWRDWVGTLETGQANEELFGLKVEQFGDLATVWAPFTIRFDSKIVGCGVNQLSMARQDGHWRVVSGIDTQAPRESCETFKETYLAERQL